MAQHHLTWNLTWMLGGLMTACPSAMAENPTKAISDKKLPIEVQGRLLDYEDKHPWCTYQEGAPIHGLGESPWARFEITSPAPYAGRTFEVLFKCEHHHALIPALRSGVRQPFVLVLPQDFLQGSYSTIEDCDIDSSVAKRWRPFKAKRRRH